MIVCYDLGEGGCVGRIEQMVLAVGHDPRYVVAARHPSGFDAAPVDRSRVEYFYIDRACDGPRRDPAECVRGPFDAAAFGREKSRLRLPDLARNLDE